MDTDMGNLSPTPLPNRIDLWIQFTHPDWRF